MVAVLRSVLVDNLFGISKTFESILREDKITLRRKTDERILKPDFKVNSFDVKKDYGRFVLENLERGFGITLGNALRRVLLSSIPGTAVYRVTIQGARHEFSALEGVVEDVTTIILNLKGLVIKMDNEDDNAAEDLKLEVVGTSDGDTTVTAADIYCPGGVHILNPDLVIAHVVPKGSLLMTISVRNGRGYVSSDENRLKYDYSPEGDSFPIPVDSSFSPIEKVNYSVEPCRVGHASDYDRLVMEVWTNGAINPQDAIALAAQILIAHFELFSELPSSAEKSAPEIFADKKTDKKGENEEKPIEEIELSVRSYNCLKRAGISTVGELCAKTEEEMMKVRNLGKKSLKEVKEKLISMGLHFKNDNN